MTVFSGASVSGFSRFGRGHESAAVKEICISMGGGNPRQELQTAGDEIGDGLGWFDGMLDPVFMGEYDLLMGHDVDFPLGN